MSTKPMNTELQKPASCANWLGRLVRLLSEWAWTDEIATTAQYGRLRERYTRLEEEHADVRGRIVSAQRAQQQYDELIYEVGTKHKGESRHETARRYIRERENRSEGSSSAVPNDKEEPMRAAESRGRTVPAQSS